MKIFWKSDSYSFNKNEILFSNFEQISESGGDHWFQNDYKVVQLVVQLLI